jgi:DNA-binding SARP family transcriptional activator
VELGVLGPLQVRQNGVPVVVPGAKPRAILTMLGLHSGAVMAADTLVELLWGEDPPRTAAKALQTHISSLRRALGDGFVLTAGAGWILAESEVDASRYKSAARLGREAATTGDTSQAVARFEEALALWRGVPELPDGRRGTSEKTRWVEGHAALVEDRLDALLATGRAAEVIGDLEAAVADAPLRERRWGQLMLALYRAGRQGEALSAYQRARSLLVDELGVDPGPELRRLEAAIVAQDASLDIPVAQNLPAMTRAVTFVLTDIEGSTAAWEADAAAMGIALARHDELVEQVVTSRGGRLIKTRGEGDATFSVFERPSAAAAAAIELQDAIAHEPWSLAEPMRIRVALHTGEAELRDGDYFGRAVNRAARLRSLAEGGQILCSGATAELVIDSLSDDVLLIDLGMRQLKNLARPEHLFELRLEAAEDHRQEVPPEAPIVRPSLPAVLAGPGPFVGRGDELGQLFSAWQTTLDGGTNAALIAGEPGVGKTRLAGEWSRQAYDQGALVIYGRCDEDLGAPYQPFAEALRSLVPCLDSKGLRGLRGVEALLALVPGLTDALPDLAAPTRADPDTERYALFDAVVALLGFASAGAPVVLILDDLHWAAKPTLLLLRHLLRFGDQARVQIIGTYRSTDLDRSHPLAAMLADLHRDGTANRIQLSGLDEKDVTAYVAEAGYDDEELARALASVTGGNPFFLIEALRHVDESGGHWDPSTLPQGVREAVSRRLSRLPAETNKALAAAAVVGSRFALELVERVVDQDLVDAFDGASKAGIIIEEHGGHYRFNHALVRQSLLAELASVRRMRLHQRIAATLEAQPGADDELLAELAYHYFECAWAGNAAKAVDYCRRAADQAMARLGYEAAAELYDRALHALEEIDEELPDRDDQATELMVTRCEALLAAGDVTTAAGAVSQLQSATADSARLAAWATCFDGELSMLVNPERLDEIEVALSAAAAKLAELGDAAGEAKAHTVRATCLARLGRVGDCEIALDDALTAARRAGEHRRVNAVLAGAPLAALWGPNPVPRAGGRCLDVVRLLRITTDSPAVEATSTRCQAVLEAFRGRAEAARRMIDSARRTVTELGLRHALLEVEQFAGIVELVVGDPAAAEPHLRQAYNGFRRMGLDADTAETAALLGRAFLALDREAEADELCTESEHLAGHALKPAIAWRTLRARLLSRRGDHGEARRIAEAAVALAERTDALVDHGDACLTLAIVLGAAGNSTGARAAAERAVDLYERKGAAALAEMARRVLGEPVQSVAPAPPEAPAVEPDNACVRVGKRAAAAVDRQVWDEVEQLFAPDCVIESRRKVIGFTQTDVPSGEWRQAMRRILETASMRVNHVHIAVRGERLALARLAIGTADVSSDAPQDEFLQLYGIDDEGRISLEMWFDIDDMDAATAELDAAHAQFDAGSVEPDTACVRVIRRAEAAANHEAWDELEQLYAPDILVESRRKITGFTQRDLAPGDWGSVSRRGGGARSRAVVIAVRGERLTLIRLELSNEDDSPGAPHDEMLALLGVDSDDRIALQVFFDIDDMDAAVAELDAAQARSEQEAHGPARRLENSATKAVERYFAHYAARDWPAMTEMMLEEGFSEDRRRTVNAGLSRGRDAVISELSKIADLEVAIIISDHMATRGQRLALSRVRWSTDGQGPDTFHSEALCLTEVEAGERIAGYIMFGLDDFDAAIAELDARYLAGEAAPHAHAWSVVTGTFASVSRNELPAHTSDCMTIDHRRVTGFAPGEMTAYIRAGWEIDQTIRTYVEVVHRLSDLGAVCTFVGHGVSRDGFDGEGRGISLATVDGDLLNRSELFDEGDLDDAITRFDQLSRPRPPLENAASRLGDRFLDHLAARDWDGLAEMLADNFTNDDRRQLVGAGVRHGRDAHIVDMRAIDDLWNSNVTGTVMAIRGERLVLMRNRMSDDNQGPEVFHSHVLSILEIDADERAVGAVTFDVEDFDSAIAELDARYLAGEAAAHARTWAAVTEAFAAINRHELPKLTPGWVNIDHRRGAAFAPGDMTAFVYDLFADTPDIKVYIQAVHRLSNRGAVVAQTAHGTSQQGMEAEWREIGLFTFDGDLLSRGELFDEADLDAALAKFDQLSRPMPRLENAASRMIERFNTCMSTGDWDAMATHMTDDFSHDDRRPVVGAGVRHGRDAHIADMRAVADLWIPTVTSSVMAIRGERLALMRIRLTDRDQGPEVFLTDVLGIVEIDSDEKCVGVATFEINDFDAAMTELDARYLAGEAAPYAHTWTVFTQSMAALNRRGMFATTPDWVNIDHRRGASFAPGELPALLTAWNRSSQISNFIEAVHRLNDIGGVVTHAAREITPEGFHAEWRVNSLITLKGDLVSRCEVFDEADIDTAIARFDQLSRPTPRLENGASQSVERFLTHFASRDWDAMAEVLADDFSDDDRRRVVSAEVRHGRDAQIANMRAMSNLTNATATVVAARGERLVLVRARFSDSDQEPQGFLIEALAVVEINADARIVAIVSFDPDDFDAAMEELETRYLAGEAAAHSHTWKVITRGNTAANLHEALPTTPDCLTIDHRLRTTLDADGLNAYVHASWGLTPDLQSFIESVHRLSDLGAVVTHTSRGTSHEDFEAEWRQITLLTIEGDLGNRCEIFDEADLDAALARFDELSRQAPRLENAASQAYERIYVHFAVRDWEAIREMMADAFSLDDRRRVVNAGVRRGRDVAIEDLKAVADIGFTVTMAGVMAVRGARLALARTRGSGRDSEAFQDDALNVIQIDADGLIAEVIVFDRDDLDAAFEELDARYVAGEASPYAHTWSVVSGAYATLNRHELPATTPDWVNIDHRPLQRAETSDLAAYIRATWDVKQHGDVYIEAVHRLSELGAVVTHAGHGTSQEGFDAEWRAVNISTVDGDLIKRSELFDEADIDAAIARFEELHPQSQRLENAASQVEERFWSSYVTRDWEGMAKLFADRVCTDDRRRAVNAGVRHGRDNQLADMRSLAEFDANITGTVIAIRGERLVLTSVCSSNRNLRHGEWDTQWLVLAEIGADELFSARVVFDADDIDAAFDELDARYLAGEAAPYAHTWSVIARVNAAFNRHELTGADWVSVDHRRGALFTSSNMSAYISAARDLTPNLTIRIEAVHRLNGFGAVVTDRAHETSPEGFDAEWRMIQLLIVDSDRISGVEIFDEADLDAALARFDELQPQPHRLENAATRVNDRFQGQYAARNWEAIADMLDDDFVQDDRRRVVGAGVRHGRDAQMADLRAIADVWVTNITPTIIATRGERLFLMRAGYSAGSHGSEASRTETFVVAEINADERIVASVSFDLDDLDAAFAELDARYLAGEAAAYSPTWSVIAGAFAALNRGEMPATTPHLVDTDHRSLAAIGPGDLKAYLRAGLDDLVRNNIYIEAVHRLTDLGAVITHVAKGTSREGFDAEWRLTDIITVEGDLISMCEMFDETRSDAALARFEELHREAPVNPADER